VVLCSENGCYAPKGTVARLTRTHRAAMGKQRDALSTLCNVNLSAIPDDSHCRFIRILAAFPCCGSESPAECEDRTAVPHCPCQFHNINDVTTDANVSSIPYCISLVYVYRTEIFCSHCSPKFCSRSFFRSGRQNDSIFL
jgi:hypothetical protein